MLLLAKLGVATPLFIIGDRLSVFIPPGPFLSLMGKVGGYDHLKQLGVGSQLPANSWLAQLAERFSGSWNRQSDTRVGDLDDVGLCCAAGRCICDCAVAGARHKLHRPSNRGSATRHSRRVRAMRFAFERTLVAGFRFLTTQKVEELDYEFTPAIGRRAFVLGTIGLAVAGGGVALARKLYRAAAFSYDGTQYKAASFSRLRLTSCSTA